MSTIDLNRLVIRKRYSIPIKASGLGEVIAKQLTACDADFFGLKAWVLLEKTEKGFLFCWNVRHGYVVSNIVLPTTEEKVREVVRKYDADSSKAYFEELSSRTGGQPFDFCVHVVKTDNESCLVDVDLTPVLYRQIVQLHKKAEEYAVQDSYLKGERFLRIIFESGLGATTVSEVKSPIPKPTVEVLINDAYLRQITDKLQKMFEEATDEILIIGWIGTFFISTFKELKQKGIDIFVATGSTQNIRQDEMRKEKSKAFAELIKVIDKTNICVKPELHGRMVIVDNKALIGSADLDSYSLTGARVEFATYTEDPATVISLRRYFKEIFSPLKDVTSS
jgi:phosphatidylserine/phosphatidylglycerophosphate/cardiolipin synthase-like enzyme